MSELKEKDVIGVNVTPTNASLKTEHFQLPIFVAGDKPKWLVDWNNSMTEIDRILYEIQTKGTVNENSISALTQNLEQANTAITNLQTATQNLSERLTALGETSATHDNEINTIQQDLIAQNALVKSMQATLNNIDGQVDSLQSTADLVEQDVSTLKNDTATLKTDVRNLESNRAFILDAVLNGQSARISLEDTIFRMYPELLDRKYSVIVFINPSSRMVGETSAIPVKLDSVQPTKRVRGAICTVQQNSGVTTFNVNESYIVELSGTDIIVSLDTTTDCYITAIVSF